MPFNKETETKYRGLSPHKITPMSGVLHAKSGLRVVLKWKIYRPDSVIADVIPLMKPQLLFTAIVLFSLVGLIGCYQRGDDISQVNRTEQAGTATETQSETETNDEELVELQRELELLRGPELDDLAAVDKIIHEFDGIQIQGSALTDIHVSSIMKLTNSFAEIHSGCKSDRIVHNAHNKCYRIWRYEGGSSAVNLELTDGRWETGSITGSIECNFGDD